MPRKTWTPEHQFCGHELGLIVALRRDGLSGLAKDAYLLGLETCAKHGGENRLSASELRSIWEEQLKCSRTRFYVAKQALINKGWWASDGAGGIIDTRFYRSNMTPQQRREGSKPNADDQAIHRIKVHVQAANKELEAVP